MKNTETISDYIIDNVRQNLGLECGDTSKDDEINEMDGTEILNRYFNWEGIIGYGNEMVEVISDIFNVEIL